MKTTNNLSILCIWSSEFLEFPSSGTLKTEYLKAKDVLGPRKSWRDLNQKEHKKNSQNPSKANFAWGSLNFFISKLVCYKSSQYWSTEYPERMIPLVLVVNRGRDFDSVL